MKRLLLVLAFAGICSAQVSAPTWTQHRPGGGFGPPAFAGWNDLWFDPIAQQTCIYALKDANTQGGIYSTDISCANLSGATPTWALQAGGTGSLNDTQSAATTNTANHPKDRHPYGHPIIDTYRRIAVLLGGSNSGGINDMLYEVLHSDPSSNNGTWTVITPGGGTYPNVIQFDSGVYDSTWDIYVDFGYNNSTGQDTWIYCNTIPIGGGSATSVLTAAQTAFGGCSSKDTWLKVSPGTQPPNSSELGAATLQNPTMRFDPYIGKTLLYGGYNNITTLFSNQVWSYEAKTNVWTELCTSSCVRPTAQTNVTGFMPVAFDSNRGYLWVHIPTSGTGKDCYFRPSLTTSASGWTCYANNGGETDIYTVMEFDAENDRLLTWGNVSAPFSDAYTSAPLGGRVFQTGSGAPSGGNDGDLYHRTDTKAIYGPKIDGSWPSTFSYITGIGCTTAYHIDKDCDGYGVGPTILTADPNPLLGVDADDNDATVNTSASVISTYGTISSFLTHLGYPTNSIKYIDSNLGNDSTGTGTVGAPYKTFQPLASTFNYAGAGTGGTIIWRAGVMNWGSVSNPFATSSAAPVVIMPYPGERVTVLGINNDSQTYGQASNTIYDGFTLYCPNTGLGNGYDGNHVNGITLKNMEIAGCGHGWQVGSGGQSLVMDNDVFHDTSSHAIYPTSAGLYAAGQFDCPAWVWDTTGGNFPSGYNPFTNLAVTNSLIYNSGTGGLEAVHLNAYICGGSVTGNNLHNIGGTGLGLQTGVQGQSGSPFLIANNIIASNQSAAITMSIYGCDNNGSAATTGQFMMGGTCFGSSFSSGVTYYPGFFKYISIVNNTLWTGQYATQGGGQCSPTDPSAPGGQCNPPSYGIDLLDYSVGTPDSKWLKNTTIQNNLILTYNTGSNGTNQLQFSTNSFPDTNTIKNNLFYNLAAGNSQNNLMFIDSTAQSSFPGTYTFTTFGSYNTGNNSGNLFGDPLFVDTALGYYATPQLFNFHLSGGSPAIGTGLHAGAPTTDAAGLTRPNPPSIGAFEVTGATTGGGSVYSGKFTGGGKFSGGP